MTAAKGPWYRMPSGQTAEVCCQQEVLQPMQDGDTKPMFVTEVTLRYLNTDGAMSAGEFYLKLNFLLKHGKRVNVAPPISV